MPAQAHFRNKSNLSEYTRLWRAGPTKVPDRFGRTKHLAPPVTETLDDFSALLQKELTARRVLVQAYAHGSAADANLDTGIRCVFSSTLHLTGQDRKRTEFTSLFGSSIAAMVRHALRKQLEVTKDPCEPGVG
jgi:hypothetical protein